MNVWNLRGEAKTEVRLGSWNSGKMPKTAMPLSKQRHRSYKLGNQWRWRLVNFLCEGRSFRLLIAHDSEKEQFLAMLGEDTNGDTKVVASIEHHGTHPGWHIHFCFEKMSSVPSGVVRGPWVRKKRCGKHASFLGKGVDFESWVFSQVCEAYGIKSAAAEGAMI